MVVEFNLEKYLTGGVENIVKDAIKALVPVLSIEGQEEKTDERRGEGTYQKLTSAMDMMQKNKVLFGASITVTKANLKEVTSKGFLHQLEEKGCKVVFYVEFVPVTEETTELAPGDDERKYLNHRLSEIRQLYDKIVFISFPGDEKSSGGCLAAGRGFFHINSMEEPSHVRFHHIRILMLEILQLEKL